MLLLFPFVLCAFSVFSQPKKPSREIASYTFEIYKQLHQYPELGKREFKTAQLIKSELQKIGYTDFYDVPDLPTCIIAALDTKNPGPAIAFRDRKSVV